MQLLEPYTAPQHTAGGKHYAAIMAREITTVEAVALNLQALMKRHGLNQTQLAKKSGVSQRHISSILKGEASGGIEVIDMLARAFGLRGWTLQVPGLPEDLLDSRTPENVLKSLAQATPEGRDLIEKQAKREAFFSKSNSST